MIDMFANRVACPLVLAALVASSVVFAEETFGPDDPIAAVDGKAVYLGELNLLLSRQLRGKDIGSLPIEVQRAAAVVLVRRHLAMRTLLAKGGSSIQASIDRGNQVLIDQQARRGQSIEALAKKSHSNEKSLIAHSSWEIAWNQYIKSVLTQKNLRRYFDQNRDKYGGKRRQISQLVVAVDSTDQASAAATVDQLKQIANRVRQSDSAEEAFSQIRSEHTDTTDDDGRVWVSKPGDVPRAVFDALPLVGQPGVLDPVTSPLGVHLVYVHEIESVEISFDDLTDLATIRRDATNALFEALVAQQQDAKIQWFIPALKPPTDVELVPNRSQ